MPIRRALLEYGVTNHWKWPLSSQPISKSVISRNKISKCQKHPSAKSLNYGWTMDERCNISTKYTSSSIQHLVFPVKEDYIRKLIAKNVWVDSWYATVNILCVLIAERTRRVLLWWVGLVCEHCPGNPPKKFPYSYCMWSVDTFCAYISGKIIYALQPSREHILRLRRHCWAQVLKTFNFLSCNKNATFVLAIQRDIVDERIVWVRNNCAPKLHRK